MVSHTHPDHRSPTYHLADLSPGRPCRSRAPRLPVLRDRDRERGGNRRSLRGESFDPHGFVADVKHMAIHGWCTACSAQVTSPQATS